MTGVEDGGPRSLRLAVVDDDTVVREGLAALLPAHVVAAAYAMVDRLLEEPPDVDLVILDLHLGGSGCGALRQGAAAVQAVSDAGYPVLIYTNENRRLVLAGCIAAGARGIVHKTEPLQAVADAASAVAAGQVVITPALVGLAEVVDRHGELPSLSPRLRQVLAGRARGETFRRIARSLGISEKVAHEYMGEVTAKFAGYLRSHSPADLERHLGIGAGDLLDLPEAHEQ
ncbi:MAG: LuxR C-terminal-related transcriptional regulator [Motilibacteraceae bacterium]